MGHSILGTQVNVIFDERQSDDYGRLLNEFIEQGITHYRFWDATVLTHSVVESISESFKKIVRWAKEEGLKEVCIAEQDLFFTVPFGWKYFLENKPVDFDLYLGGNYLVDQPDTWKPPLIKLKGYVGNHLIIISEKYYDTFLASNNKNHIDTEQDGKGGFYCCYPFVALQRSGWSANAKAVVNYNADIHIKPHIYKV